MYGPVAGLEQAQQALEAGRRIRGSLGLGLEERFDSVERLQQHGDVAFRSRGQLLQEAQPEAHGFVPHCRRVRLLRYLLVEGGEERQAFGSVLVDVVVVEVSGGPTVEIVQGLSPAHVLVVDFAKKVLGLLVDTSVGRCDLEEQSVLLRDHDIDGRSLEVGL